MVNGAGKTTAIIQARYSSERLPGKVMLPLGQQSMLGRVISAVQGASLVDEIWLATSKRAADDILEEEAKKQGIYVFRGSESDVLDRFYKAALESRPDNLVRVTGDNPFTYHGFIDEAIRELVHNSYDYTRHINIPVGSGVEVFKFKVLEEAAHSAILNEEREHITLYINNKRDAFKIGLLEAESGLDRSDLRLTVDTEEDYMLARAIVHFLGEQCRDLKRIIELLDQQPWLSYVNKNIEQYNPARQIES